MTALISFLRALTDVLFWKSELVHPTIVKKLVVLIPFFNVDSKYMKNWYLFHLQADKSEEYTIRELKEDLELCAANYVHLIVDQSFSGDVADAFRNSKRHRNVIVFASGANNEYAYGDEYSRHWTRSNHTFQCTWDIHEVRIKHVPPHLFPPICYKWFFFCSLSKLVL